MIKSKFKRQIENNRREALVVIVLMCTFMFFIYLGIQAKPYIRDDAEKRYLLKTKIESTSNEDDTGFIQNIGGVDGDLVKKFNDYYMIIPENVRNDFEDNGWNIYATTEDIGQKYYGRKMSILALTVTAEKAIYIDNREKAVKSVIHEMGHYIDYSYDFISSSAEFEEIFNAEVKTFRSIHFTHPNNTATVEEYFAEFYLVSIIDSDLVKEKCPRTYEFVTRYANNL